MSDKQKCAMHVLCVAFELFTKKLKFFNVYKIEKSITLNLETRRSKTYSLFFRDPIIFVFPYRMIMHAIFRN